MINTQVLQILLGLGGAYAFFGPQLLALGKRLLTRSKPAPEVPSVEPTEYTDPIVYTLYSLVQMRKLVSGDPKAIEAIDTVLVPAILRAEAKHDES